MNFLLRPTQNVPAEQPSVNDSYTNPSYTSKHAATLEGLVTEDPFALYSDHAIATDGVGGENSSNDGTSAKDGLPIAESHSDVSEEEGWIYIPYKELPDNWMEAPDMNSLRSLDRSFVFPGEQVHILACLLASKQDTEIITPFKVAAVMSKNGIGRSSPNNQNGKIDDGTNLESGTEEEISSSEDINQNGSQEKIDPQKDLSDSESLLRMEDYKRQSETLLQRFKNSHFFVRIAESGEALWSKRSSPETSSQYSEMDAQKSLADEIRKTAKNVSSFNAVIDRGNFDANVSGGAARNTVECCSLSNGDLAVLLQVNIGVDSLSDPVLEILQFEKYQERKSTENNDSESYANQDPCGELLKWLYPLDNTVLPPAHSPSPPINPSSVIPSPSQKPTLSTPGSQLFSFGHFRSYSMSSLPQNAVPPPQPVKVHSSKPNFDYEDWDQFASQKFVTSQKTGNEGLLSFRGVSLERERFSVRCGLEGIHIPGRRWRRKLEIIQPVEIHSFAADCNTDDLLCVQIKNISPAHTPDIVVYIDAITIVFEEASKGGPPSSLPIACIEAGNEHSLPNLVLRRGEEHSFILKPSTPVWKNLKGHSEINSQSSQLPTGTGASSLRLPSKTIDVKKISSSPDQYAIMVSCRCNYSESRLFFKQSTSWRPRISRELMISVASEISTQPPELNGKASQLPVQVLTLQASNLTSENLTLTVLAPASFTSLPSVVSLNSTPSTPVSPFLGFSELTGRVSGEKRGTSHQRHNSAPVVLENHKQNGDVGPRSVSFSEQANRISDVIPNAGLCCTHLWLQSRVPLGCVPSQSTATIKLELLPLTDGIITLDTLQIDVKEKGVTYIPEHSLKINATSSISTGIV